MALDTFANLKTAIQNALNVTAADVSSVIEDAIAISEKQIWHDLRIKEMQQSISATISSDVVPIPTDYIDSIYLYYTDSGGNEYKLQKSTPEELNERFRENFPRGFPEYYAIENANFVFGPLPDTGNTFVVKGMYSRRMAALTSASTTDTVFVKFPELYLFKTCAYLERWLGRENRVQVWDSLYHEHKMSADIENKAGSGYTKPHYL